MKETIFTCDKCKEESRFKGNMEAYPPGWITINFIDNDFKVLLCTECIKLFRKWLKE